jgi:hypothetical protein
VADDVGRPFYLRRRRRNNLVPAIQHEQLYRLADFLDLMGGIA